jgi:UDP-N-acetylglucosamine 4,6-dehydratase
MKKVLITGGTGTVGEAFIKEYYEEYDFYTLSRNELKIGDLSKKFPKVKTFLGDVKDYELLSIIVAKVMPDIIIHSAALKHIDIAEKNPASAVLNNVIGSYNVIKVALNNDVPLTIGISTDKACDPKSVYGYTKKLMEEMFLNLHTERNRFICTRFANVAGSNGSVIPYWKDLLRQGLPIKLTDKKMNRLMFSKSSAAKLIQKAILLSDTDKTQSFVLSRKMKSVNLYDLAKLMSDNSNIEITGLRPGEKLNESLISPTEIKYSKNIDEYIQLTKFETTSNELGNEYSSLTAEKMSVNEMLDLINQD